MCIPTYVRHLIRLIYLVKSLIQRFKKKILLIVMIMIMAGVVMVEKFFFQNQFLQCFLPLQTIQTKLSNSLMIISLNDGKKNI